MTLQQAYAQGYTDADATRQRGYVSRKIDPLKQAVQVAGGSRKGELYVLLPGWDTTTYCWRRYLTRD
ncbi:MAG: hypothetical protein FWG40_00480 [Peptococcaceae bacterium]|nr:hypothetical protein [Peptococcaceae bacterium]